MKLSTISRTVCLAVFTLTMSLSGVAQANQAHSTIMKLSEQNRQGLFTKFLTKSGESCSGVNKTFYQGSDGEGSAFWNVACNGGQSYSIMLKNDATGSTRIMDCKLLKAVTGSPCFKKF
jgi:hypothetical protein